MTVPPKILVPLADGFEELEAVALVDVLRRGDLEVTSAALTSSPVTGSHGISVTADALIADLDLDAFGAIVLPGGMPGTRHLAADERVLGLVRRLMGQGQTVAAICAAPLVLAAAGVLDGHAYTSHPSVGAQLPGCASSERVVRSRNLFTSRGPGTALEFALALVAHFRGPAVAHQLETAMLA